MIELPRRSLTRFFIPLIDVLILLFAMFILLPVVDDRSQQVIPDDPDRLRQALADLQKRLRQLEEQKGTPEKIRKELENLRKQLENLPELVEPVILQIDPETGVLKASDEQINATLKITSQDDALSFIEKKKRWLEKKEREEPLGAKRALLFIFRYPPAELNSPHPSVAAKARYERWFRDQKYRFSR